MLPTSQSWSSGFDTHNSTGMISPFTTVTNQHPTPPRLNGNTLPSTPSSERLQAIAPSPITVIPRSRLRYSPPSPSRANANANNNNCTPPRRPPRPSVAQALSFSLRQQERAASVYSEGEDEVSAIVQSYMRLSNSHTEGGQSDGEDDIQVPIILDNGSRAAQAAIRMSLDRSIVPHNIPEEVEDVEFLNVAPTPREEEKNMTPGEFYRAHYKPQVMVRFNTHVFGQPAPGEPNDENDNGPVEASSPTSQYDNDDDDDSDRKASTTSSWYVPERRLTDFSDFYREQSVRDTVINEEDAEDNDTTPGVFSSTMDPLAASVPSVTRAGAPALEESDKTSPESFNTELITPAHDDVPLPVPPRVSSDQGVARPNAPLDGKHVDRRFLPAKSSFRPSTAPVERPLNVPAAPAITILKRPKLIAPTPRGNTAEGLQLDTTGRRSIDVDRERAIEHAGGTPGRPSRLLEDKNTPPVPPLPQHLLKLPEPTAVQAVEAKALTPEEISKILDELEDPDIEPCAETEEECQEVDLPLKPWPEDLARVDRTTKLELIVNQDSGIPVWCSLPIRRLSRPEYWQNKEDQELAKAIRWHDPPPKPQPFQRTGAVIFGQPPKHRTQWTFFYTSKSVPTLKGVMINDGTGKDHTRGKIKLNIKEEGVYQASGYDEAGNVEWMFQYLVTKRQAGKSRRAKRARYVFPMYFYAIAAFLDPSRGQTLFPFSKAFQPVYEAERMPVARVGQPPVHTSPPKWNIEEVKRARRTAAGPLPIQGPPVSAVGRVFGAIAGMKRSRPNTPASTDKLPKPLASSRSGTVSPAGGQVDSSGTTPVRSGGLLGGLKHKLSKRPVTSAGIVSIAPPSHSAPAALGSRDNNLQLQRFDTNASVKSGTGKSIKSMISKIGLRPSSRPGSAREGHFPRYDQVRSLAPIQPAPGLGRRRSKSAASALFPARIAPSPLGLVQEESVSSQIDESAKDESVKSGKTIMGRIRTFSVGARPNSRAKSPLAVESLVAPDFMEATADGAESTRPKSVMGRLRSLSSASRPGSSRVTPVDHPNFDLEELLSAREAAGSALDTHDPTTSLVKHTRGLSGSVRPSLPRSHSSTSQISSATARPGIPRSQSNTSQLSSVTARPHLPRSESNVSQISPTPPFVLEELLRARAIGSSDSLAASITSSPILGPANWKGKGKEIVPELRSGSSGRPGSSREVPVWFTASQANVGSSKSINSMVSGEGPSGSSSAPRVLPPLQKVANRVTIIRGEGSHRSSISLKHSSLSVQDIAEYVDGKFSSSTLSAISLDSRSGSDSGADEVQCKPADSMTFEDAVEMSNKRRGLGPSTSLHKPTMVALTDEHERSEYRPEPLVRKNTFERLLIAGESLTVQAINTSVQRIVEENHLTPIEEVRSSTPPRSVDEPLVECVVLPRAGGAIQRMRSLASIDPNVSRSASTLDSIPLSKVGSNVPRSKPPTADAYGLSRNKENDPASKSSKLNVVVLPEPDAPLPPPPNPSFWQRLTRPRSLSNLKAAAATPLTSVVDAPPLPPLPRAAQPIVSSPSFSRGDAFAPYYSAKSMGKRPATSSGEPARSPLPRSTASSSSISSMANPASTNGIVLMPNATPAHLKDRHPFAVAIRPIEGRIKGSEWTNLNPQPTHYVVEDLAFKRAMEDHREELKEYFPPARMEGGSRPNSATSSVSGRPPLKPILRKRPSTTQTEQMSQDNLDTNFPPHLRPNRWNSREMSPVPSPLSSASGPMPPRRERPSTAQVQR